MRKRILVTVAVAFVLAGVFVPLAGAVSVSVRVEGKTQTIFGAGEPRIEVASTALDALTAAATSGEFYYHLTVGSLGSYVDQIGLYPATGTGGWMFKLNGAQPPVGADAVTLRPGDRVLWYWAGFDPVTFAGPKTLLLTRSKLLPSERVRARRSHEKLSCYAVSAQDDKGVGTPAAGALVRAGSRRAVIGEERTGLPGGSPGLARAGDSQRRRALQRLAVNRFLIPFSLILLVAIGLAGCGQGEKGEGQVWVTRDRGATLLDSGTVPAGLTALQGLDRIAEIETGYGGAFVNEIDGVAGSHTHQRDWFFFVNGYEADRGAASYRLRAGDVEWWDYRSWHGSERVPMVVGAFPEPFLHGYDGKRRAAAVRFGPGLGAEAHALARVVRARSVAAIGKPVAAAANLLVVTAGRPGMAAGLRSGVSAGEPVRFVVTGRAFARSLARNPALVRGRYQAVGWDSP